MNGIIRVFGEDMIVEHVDNITMEEGHVEFFDIYANCKDIALDDFAGFKFDRKEEVMVATKQKGGLPRHHWFPNAYLLSYNRAGGNMILNYINKEGEDDYFPFNPNDLVEIVFEEEEEA